MKNKLLKIILPIIVVLAIGFANADVSQNNNKKASESAYCPYLIQL
jgi:hypothetical protein